MLCGVLGSFGVLCCAEVMVSVCSIVRTGRRVVTVVVGGGGCMAWCGICLVGAGDRAGLWVFVWCMMEVWYVTSCGVVLCRWVCLRVGWWVRV